MKFLQTLFLVACCILSMQVFGQIKVDAYGDVFIGSTTSSSYDAQGDMIITQDGLSNSLTFYSGVGSSLRIFRGTVLDNKFAYITRSGTTNNGIIMDNLGKVGIRKEPDPTYDLDVLGSIRAYSATYIISDKRVKKNIVKFQTPQFAYDSLQPYKYNYRTYKAIPKISNSEQFDLIISDSVQQTQNFGFIAQDVQKYFPELISTDENGFLSVNYDGFIPILWQSNKELRFANQLQQKEINELKHQVTRIDELELQISKLQSKNNGNPKLKSGNLETNLMEEASTQNTLAQNYPNPWNASTEIGLTLDKTVKTASLCIYDMTGKQIRCFTISERGETAVTIHAEELQAGMYFYSLLADGKLIDSKKMVLTE